MRYRQWIIIGVILAIVLFITLKPKQEIVFSKEDYKSFKATATQQEVFEVINKNMVTGGPPKDGIPSIDFPEYLSATEADKELAPEDIIFGINYKGVIKAYPQDIMYWHEIVNEEIDGEQIAVTYCPLTGSVIGFTGKELGVSGKLYNSNLVMYDRASDGEIPQILQTTVNGPTAGEKLKNLHVYVTTWAQWKKKYPETLVLSRKTGFGRDYNKNPYPGYESLLRVWFPVAAKSDQFHAKAFVTSVALNGKYLAIPKKEFKKKGKAIYILGEETLHIVYDIELDIIKVYKNEIKEQNRIPSFDVYWFAWYAYHPDTEIFR